MTKHDEPERKENYTLKAQQQQQTNRCSQRKFVLIGTVWIILQLLLLNLGLARKRVNSTGSYSSISQHMTTNLDWFIVSSSSQQQQQQQQQQYTIGRSKTKLTRKKKNINERHFEEEEGIVATFNGYPLKYHERQMITKTTTTTTTTKTTSNSTNENNDDYYSLYNCVGQNYQEKHSWMQRSCQFSFLCYDMTEKEFVIFQNNNNNNSHNHIETDSKNAIKKNDGKEKDNKNNKMILPTVSLGGINHKWGYRKLGVPLLEWFPIIRTELPNSFYTLPSNVVLVPFHSLSGSNPGHLLWDDFLPIYTLLDMFQMISTSSFTNNDNNVNISTNVQLNETDETINRRRNSSTSSSISSSNEKEFLLIRYIMKQQKLWASCDFRPDKTIACSKMHNKFWPVMRTNNNYTYSSILTSTNDTQFKSLEGTTSNNNNKHNNNKINHHKQPKSNLICARHGVAGIGSLTDHGTRKAHGWLEEDYQIIHNHGRAGTFWNFRNFVMNNIGIVQTQQQQQQKLQPFKIIFSLHSSQRSLRNDFSRHIKVLREAFPTTTTNNNNNNLDGNNVIIEAYTFKDYSLEEQIEIANTASIFVTQCGGGAMTSMFVPKGSSIFIYYNEKGGVKNNKATLKPARLDFDFFNNLGYARVHWIPSKSMYTEIDNFAFVELVRHELNIIAREQEKEKGKEI